MTTARSPLHGWVQRYRKRSQCAHENISEPGIEDFMGASYATCEDCGETVLVQSS